MAVSVSESPSVTEFAWVVVPVLAVNVFVYMTPLRATSVPDLTGLSYSMQYFKSTLFISTIPLVARSPRYAKALL